MLELCLLTDSKYFSTLIKYEGNVAIKQPFRTSPKPNLALRPMKLTTVITCSASIGTSMYKLGRNFSAEEKPKARTYSDVG